MEEKIKMAVSTCLLGEKVRYDGGHKRDPYIIDTLGQWLDYVPVCPEVECGLPVPRESMRLVGTPDSYRLVTMKTKEDHTPRMEAWGKKKLLEMGGQELCGYIFKSKSPSSGMERVKIYGDSNRVWSTGRGIWARMFMDRFPLLPCEEEGRLHDPVLRDNFITRVFVMKRWRDSINKQTTGELVEFHTRHKLLILAHSEKHYRQMGPLVAKASQMGKEELFASYLDLLTSALALKSTLRKNANVLMHILGFFKKKLEPFEKQEMLSLIDAYKARQVPLIVPVTMINHYVKKFDETYLAGQVYLHPHPAELGLRNHA